ncbi:MAG TPA: hypothetical protein EYN67_00935 [Flavobacteriales bacterium]|nr:hypothetical protein [Flavobacteriales bacterium]
MNSDQILALMPIIVLSLCAVVLMLQASVRRNAKVAWNISALGLIAAIWGAGYSLDLTSQVTPLIIIDRWGLMFTTLILIASMVTLLLSRESFSKQQKSKDEYYLLLILAVLGAVVLIHSSHVATLLLGMELMGIALYAMIAFPEKGNLSLEAAIKYLVLSACASAMLLFGFALLYAATGDLSYVGMASKAAIAYADNPASLGFVLNCRLFPSICGRLMFIRALLLRLLVFWQRCLRVRCLSLLREYLSVVIWPSTIIWWWR